MPKPASDAPTLMPLTPNAASSTPRAASTTVSGLGTRRVHKSMAAPPPAPATTVARTMKSDGLANVLPESQKNRVAEQRDPADRGERDQCGEQSVLQQILAFVPKHQAANRRHHYHWVRLSRNEGRSVLRPSLQSSRRVVRVCVTG